MRPRVLVIDNYDSFTFNLVQLLGELGAEPLCFRNDAISLREIRELCPTHIVLSPGPGHPQNPRDFGIGLEVLQKISPTIPTLGVCLGHQGIAVAYGGRVEEAPELVHGKASRVYHDGQGVFRGLPQGFRAGRYHSLVVDPDSLPASLRVSAVGERGEVMGIRHERFPIEGVQFHPESILTEHGPQLMANFLGLGAPQETELTRARWGVGAP